MENLFTDLSKNFDNSQFISLYEFSIKESEQKIVELADDFNKRILKEITKRTILKEIENLNKEILNHRITIEKINKINKIDDIDDSYALECVRKN